MSYTQPWMCIYCPPQKDVKLPFSEEEIKKWIGILKNNPELPIGFKGVLL